MTPKTQWAWLAAFAVVVVAPVLLYAFAGAREHTSLIGRLVTISGAQAAGMLAYTIAVGSRMKARGFGAHIHRLCGEATLGAVVLHVLFVLALQPDNGWLLVVLDAPPPGAAGTSALLALAFVVALAVKRKEVDLPAATWRRVHVVGAWLAALFALAHILWLGHLAAIPAWTVYLAALTAVPPAMWATRAKAVERGRADASR